MFFLTITPARFKKWELNNGKEQQVSTKSKQTHTTKNHPCSNGKMKLKKKRTTFTYYSPQIRKITSVFKHTNTGIAFRNTNTLQQLTKSKTQ